MSRPRASVIIPTFNKARYLARTLASWLSQRLQDYELVIVNDGSTDDTISVLRRYDDRLPIRYETFANAGRSVARNRALELARGEIIIFSDDDRVVGPDFVAAHVTAFERTTENLVVLGMHHGLLCEVRSGERLPPATILRLANARAAWRTALIEGRSFETVGPEEVESDLARIIEQLRIPDPWFKYVLDVIREHGHDLTGFGLAWTLGATGNMSVRADALRAVGHFDEDFKGWGLEDFELHYRLEQGGARTRVCTAAINYHQNHPRNSAALDESFRENARIFLEKHPGVGPILFFMHCRGLLPLARAGQMTEELVSSRSASALARALPALLRTSLEWLPDPRSP